MLLLAKRIVSFLIMLSTPLLGLGIFLAFLGACCCLVAFAQTWFLFVPLLLLGAPLCIAILVLRSGNSKE